MKIKRCNSVCDKLLAGVDRPINSNFQIDGFLGTFSICTYEYMRGPFGLQEGEYPGDYFLTYGYSERNTGSEIMFRFEFSPLKNTYRVKDFTNNKGKKWQDYEQTKSMVTAVILSACVEV